MQTEDIIHTSRCTAVSGCQYITTSTAQHGTHTQAAQSRNASSFQATTRSCNRTKFRLLVLPRELRDLIYGFALLDKQAVSLCGTTFKLRPRQVAQWKLLSVCRQVRIEYQEAVDQSASLEVYDLTDTNPSPAEMTSLPAAASDITSLVVHLISDAVLQGISEMMPDKLWVDEILHLLPNLRSLSVSTHAPLTFSFGIARMEAELAAWMKLPLLHEFKVWDAFKEVEKLRTIEEHDSLSEREVLVMECPKEGGDWKDLDQLEINSAALKLVGIGEEGRFINTSPRPIPSITAAPNLQQAMVATHPRTTNAADAQRNIFRFFDLPRELRDMVYEYALVDGEPTNLCETKHKTRAVKLQPRNIARWNILTVCQQLKSEMGKVAGSRATLHVFDLVGDIPDANKVTSLPVAAARTSALVLHLIRANDKNGDEDYDLPEIQDHSLWIDKLSHLMPMLCTLTVIVHTHQEQTCGSAEIRALRGVLAPLLELAHLEKIEVHKAEDVLNMSSIENHDAATDNSLMVMKWSAVGGEWEEVQHETTAVDKPAG
ncbi:hypothetical protein TI39_contig357g00016 [Zymoseptoria brevis]|uniref:Uncharacterized protein n=1 Tax=Zymoseptoria brevis TaxID=1047168 RepID=A0A0F4GPW1_9PEZI|nr:hypothetical protein TI39_contig357g00016 [Zymoseptoria brevis]